MGEVVLRLLQRLGHRLPLRMISEDEYGAGDGTFVFDWGTTFLDQYLTTATCQQERAVPGRGRTAGCQQASSRAFERNARLLIDDFEDLAQMPADGFVG